MMNFRMILFCLFINIINVKSQEHLIKPQSIWEDLIKHKIINLDEIINWQKKIYPNEDSNYNILQLNIDTFVSFKKHNIYDIRIKGTNFCATFLSNKRDTLLVKYGYDNHQEFNIELLNNAIQNTYKSRRKRIKIIANIIAPAYYCLFNKKNKLINRSKYIYTSNILSCDEIKLQLSKKSFFNFVTYDQIHNRPYYFFISIKRKTIDELHIYNEYEEIVEFPFYPPHHFLGQRVKYHSP